MAQTALDCANSALRKLGGMTVTAVDGSDTSKEGAAIFGHLDPCKKNLLRRSPWNFAIKRKALVAPSSFAISNVTYISGNIVEITHATATYTTGQYVTISGVVGASAANGVWEIQNAVGVTTTRLTIPTVSSSTILGTYSSGGTIRLSPAFDYGVIYALPSGILKLISVNEGILTGRHVVEGGYILTDEDTSIRVKYVQDITDYAAMDVGFYECLSTYLAWTICDHISGSDQKKRDLWTDLNGGDGKVGMLPKARFDDAVEDSMPIMESNEWINARGGTWFEPVVVEQSTL